MKRATELPQVNGAARWTEGVEQSYENWLRRPMESILDWADQVERSYEQFAGATGLWASAMDLTPQLIGGQP